MIESLCELLAKGESVVVATVVKTPGQALLAGAKMLVRSNGVSIGTIGGGLLEAKALDCATELFAVNPPRVKILEFSGEALANKHSICGKGMMVFIEHIAASPENVRLYRKLLNARRNGVKCCILTFSSSEGSGHCGMTKGLVCDDGATFGEVSCPDERLASLIEIARSAMAPVLKYFGDLPCFIDPWTVPQTVYLVGAGHVAREVSELTSKAGFRTIVMDDREKMVSPERFPLADDLIVLDSFEGCLGGLELHEDSYIFIITRERRYEKTVLRQALATRAGYIGVIGSIRKRDALFKDLMEEGFSIDDLLRIYCPVGLNILAESTVEIAVSVMAQLVLVRAGKTAEQKKKQRRAATLEVVPSSVVRGNKAKRKINHLEQHTGRGVEE